MPLFAQFFGALFSALGGFLLKIFVARIAVRIAAVTLMTTLAAGLFATFNALISPWIAMVFNTQYGQFLGLLFPPISGTIITALMAFWLAVKTYQMQQRAIAVTAGM
jgi:hypothetical protein